MDEFVEVVDIVVVTTVPGLTLGHTVRAHEGDREETTGSSLLLHYGDREVQAGGEKRKTAGKTVRIPLSHAVEITKSTRFEPRVRPTVASLVTKGKAEIDARITEALANADAAPKKP